MDNEIARYVVRRRRITEKGWNLTDIEVNHHFPSSTSSYIEKGENVKEETLNLYLRTLDMTKKELKKLTAEATEEIKELKFQLKQIERMIETGYIETAKCELAKYQIEDFHPLAPLALYLKGLTIQRDRDAKKRYQKAKKKYNHAIQVCSQYSLHPEDNIIAASYNGLAACSYFLNDLDQAINYIDQGLAAYDEAKKGKGIKYKLLSNKMQYLWDSSQYDQATSILYEVWPQKSKIDKTNYALLDFYKYRSMILRNQNMYEEALRCCLEGIEIATSIGSQNRYLDLLIILGSIYLTQGDFDKAYDRFKLVLTADHECEYPRRHVDAHTYLGILFNAKNDWHQATVHLEEAIQIAREITEASRLAKALIVRGNVHLIQEQYPEALPYYQESEKILETDSYKHRQHTALLKLAHCFDKMGKTNDLQDCLLKKYRLEVELSIKSEVEIYEVF
ncbi:tetratricopeptide repeat protein [Paenactinomyces guangxiensis]|uniref:Tetratricopeptide repeat protein n=1 Tax=Paenactinomyces guangxiensis TaxID=1490290 RepID=A0A7W1WQ10_9BACL|nr:tetratricopeptide repeat protein [Paenactinomyces guangxiensis]MBA4493814.1 tetratricopeptide repeat protein [Paenactinomyces guangxiensis]MBH8591280.1 tetratricopeptide repeat protein [Paenactinomyces guangxiensis]